ncbi:hybrid sensor histidine kinase/response regulator [Polluticoccus soli]|uniref:hybrid sensor histidine kinase/response regulator n=1 Tax=Polluticoccus soli TaxID=3034150 RepID=UPI0023E15AF1|nr:hybrid sensor histidine kinase/response regulator [Flavipsychrobacter sp. JY13-12]
MSAENHKVKILIVDDDEDDFIITSEYIKHIPATEYVTDWCPKYADALQHMIKRDYDLYFVDYRLGAKSGVELLQEALDNNCEEPIILLTGKGNYEVDIKAMQLGAVDYLIKTELSIEKMERSIRYALGRAATLKALKANERKYRGIFEKSKDVVFLIDEKLNFKDVNAAILPLLGYTKEEVLQMNLGNLIDQAQHRKFLLQTLQGRREIDDWEVVFKTKKGERKSCILTATREEETSPVYIQGIIHDITNLKKIEKATLQAEKLAATGRLVRTLAHEVRNPLNNITLSVEQMQQEEKNDTMLVYLDIIHRNSRRISDLIGELLNTSRPTEIKLGVSTIQTVLDDVISSAIDRLTLKRIKLKVTYPDNGLQIFADKEKLKLALLNIVINAIEAMEEQKGTLTITLAQVQQQAVLKIADDGVGISEENITRLFEPYFTQKRNGMGLGLAFTLNILQAHKATVDVASKVGQGTTFTITFPMAESVDSEVMTKPGMVERTDSKGNGATQ